MDLKLAEEGYLLVVDLLEKGKTNVMNLALLDGKMKQSITQTTFPKVSRRRSYRGQEFGEL